MKAYLLFLPVSYRLLLLLRTTIYIAFDVFREGNKQIVLCLLFSSTIVLIWKWATWNLSLLLVYVQNNVYFWCHDWYRSSTAWMDTLGNSCSTPLLSSVMFCQHQDLFDAVHYMSVMMPTQEDRLMAGSEKANWVLWNDDWRKLRLHLFCKLIGDEQLVYLFDTPAWWSALPTT